MMDRIDDLVSVILPSYNGERFIADAIASVLSQTYPRIEFIIADDSSSDRTRSIVSTFKDSRIRFIGNDRNIGLVENLNKGIRASQGGLICWINQDDRFYPEKVARQMLAMRGNPKIGVCFTQKDDIDEFGQLHRRFNPSQIRIQEEDHLIQLFGGCYLSAPTVMMRRSAYDRLGGFDNRYRIAFDYDMWFRMKKIYDFLILNEPLVAFRHHSGNLSSEKNESIVTSECAAIVRNALNLFKLEEIYPFLQTIIDRDRRRVETAACLLALATLIWRQKKWNLQLAPEVIELVDQTIALVPEMLGAYEFGESVADEAGLERHKYRYCSNKLDLINVYYELTGQLRSSFDQGDAKAVSEIFNKMYAVCPMNGDPFYQLALLYKKISDNERAIHYCKNSLTLNNDHTPAQILMATLSDTSTH